MTALELEISRLKHAIAKNKRKMNKPLPEGRLDHLKKQVERLTIILNDREVEHLSEKYV